MKLRIQELRWQSGNQLFQIQQFRDMDGAWVAIGDCYHTLAAATEVAEKLLHPKLAIQPEEIIHELPQ
jgi:hypothetical protein